MKKRRDLTGFEALEKQLLAVYRSGVYLSGRDIAAFAADIGHETAMKKRESALKKLILQAKNDGTTHKLFDAIMRHFQQKIKEYEMLEDAYPGAKQIIGEWIQKADRTVAMLTQQKEKIKEDSDAKK